MCLLGTYPSIICTANQPLSEKKYHFLVQTIDFDALWQEDDDGQIDASDAKPAAVRNGGDAEMGEAE